MAKKKLFGNVKEPCCETCAHGKLSANGESVLCVQGGAVPLDHSCRRYQYDPLRRVPKRRPQPGSFSAADFALDDVQPVADTEPSVEKTAQAPKDATLRNLFAYLDEHETPDADTIRAILNKTYDPEKEADESTVAEDNAEVESQTEAELDAAPETEIGSAEDVEETALLSDEELLERMVEEATQANTVLSPDNTPDIEDDLARLDMTAIPAFALTPLSEEDDVTEPLVLSEDSAETDVGMITDIADKTNAPLSVDDLLFLPKGTPSDNDESGDFSGGFTPLTGNE